MSGWRLYVRNQALEIIGQIDTWTKFGAELRYNLGGNWSLTMPHNEQAKLLQPGCGVVCWGPNGLVFSGQMRKPGRSRERSGVAEVNFAGIDDTARLGFRIVLPDPTTDLHDQALDSHWVDSGVAETVIRQLISVNAGPGARLDRRIPNLALSSDEARGTSVNVSSRFDNLLEQATALATSGGVRFWIEQELEDLVLRFSQPADVAARFSVRYANLRGYDWTIAAPSATHALVAGQGELTARTFVLRSDPGAVEDWGERIETFVDARDTDDGPTLQQRGDEALADGAAAGGLSSSPVDVPGMSYGLDYNLGDLAEVDLGDGLVITDTIRQISIAGDRKGVRVTPTVGGNDTNVPQLYPKFKQLQTRLNKIERSV